VSSHFPPNQITIPEMPKESKKPENTAFKQQRLKSWQPLLTPKSVIPAFFIIGLLFVPLGIVLHLASDKVVEVRFDYTKCPEATAQFTTSNVDGIKEWKYDSISKNCTIRFEVPQAITGPVYMYYRLSNFYQNNRKYVKSFDLKQLKGQALTSVDAACDPLSKVPKPENVKVNGQTVSTSPDAIYYPCGLIANSLFSGIFFLFIVDEISDLGCISSDYKFPDNKLCDGKNVILYQFSHQGIAWTADAEKYL
jgi:hypothetical protein